MAQSVEKLTLTLDAEKFRADLQSLADDIKADMAKSLDERVRAIVRDEIEQHRVRRS